MTNKTNTQLHYESIKTLLELTKLLDEDTVSFNDYCLCKEKHPGKRCIGTKIFKVTLHQNIRDRLEWLICQIDRFDMVNYKGKDQEDASRDED